MNMYMKTVILNGEDFATIEQLHSTLRQVLELPDTYGANLDALWDSLTGQIQLPLQIEWLHYDLSEERLGDDAQQVLGLMEEVQGEGNGFRVWVQKGAVAF
ncbi:barstar family protein [Paenibacillus sp. WLX1005]|uniref:barstar family protein n=1 Tax=unclassified Paenibacillus TaxID=185978 RepID=UPI00398432B4